MLNVSGASRHTFRLGCRDSVNWPMGLLPCSRLVFASQTLNCKSPDGGCLRTLNVLKSFASGRELKNFRKRLTVGFNLLYCSMIAAAKSIANHWHNVVAKQVRKYSGLPYTVHTDSVAGIVARHGGNDHQIAAAHLHDTLEDTPLTTSQLFLELELFGIGRGDAAIIVKLVVELTDVYDKAHYPAFNRAQRKDLERARQASISDAAKAVKLADCIDNGRDIKVNDPGFAKVYISEIGKLFPLIKDAHAGLAAELESVLTN